MRIQAFADSSQYPNAFFVALNAEGFEFASQRPAGLLYFLAVGYEDHIKLYTECNQFMIPYFFGLNPTAVPTENLH